MKTGKLYEQQRAYGSVQNALWSGRLKQPNKCGMCNKKCVTTIFETSKVYAHHPDYNNKLFVIWVCAKCHRKLHTESAKEDRIRRKEMLKSIIMRKSLDINIDSINT